MLGKLQCKLFGHPILGEMYVENGEFKVDRECSRCGENIW